jgi:hypothetical protein
LFDPANLPVVPGFPPLSTTETFTLAGRVTPIAAPLFNNGFVLADYAQTSVINNGTVEAGSSLSNAVNNATIIGGGMLTDISGTGPIVAKLWRRSRRHAIALRRRTDRLTA